VPIRDGHFRAIALGHLDMVGLDLMVAIKTPDDQPHARRGGVAERHGRAGFGFHVTCMKGLALMGVGSDLCKLQPAAPACPEGESLAAQLAVEIA